MICPQCQFEQPDENVECPKCGIVFEKYVALQDAPDGEKERVRTPAVASTDETERTPLGSYLKELFLFVKPGVNPLFFGGRVIIFLVIFIWGWKFILTPLESNYTAQSFLHLVNLPFHEAGHIIFSPFGKFIMTLGGTLGQLLMPLICVAVLLFKTRDTFGASVALWWFGENFMDIAPYINDARALELMLLGGVTGKDVIDYHDWEYILRKLGWLQYDHTLASLSYFIGIVIMLATFAWGGYLLFKQFKDLARTTSSRT
ncbi:MAG: zinc ribbon domain-containing protein [Deltaproteobacteria bacterium]|nr:zinc ribbon domain-containing protein [Deltaproteobacteria bacterium]